MRTVLVSLGGGVGAAWGWFGGPPNVESWERAVASGICAGICAAVVAVAYWAADDDLPPP